MELINQLTLMNDGIGILDDAKVVHLQLNEIFLLNQVVKEIRDYQL